MTGQSFWRVVLEVEGGTEQVFADPLESEAAAVSAFELAPGGAWRIEALFEAEPDRGAIDRWLALVAQEMGVAPRSVLIDWLPPRDWLAENRKAFPPQRLGRFFVRGTHVTEPTPASLIPIHLDASLAFGSGEHATTRGCLAAIERHVRRRRPRHVLDLGTGSGILAIAAAKLAPCRVLAVDIDRDSVRLARENVARNGVAAQVHARLGKGCARVPRGRRYDLILANILARPLMRLARPLALRRRRGGRIVLSGLLREQIPLVLSAYRAQGLALARRDVIDGWATLTLGPR